jgi:hypothetical protein
VLAAVHEMMWPRSVGATFQSLLYLLLTVGAQCILIFAFEDTAWLGAVLGQFPLFAEPIKLSNFYPPELCWGTSNDQPALTVMCAFISVLLVSLCMRQDNLATMSAAQPIDLVRHHGSHSARTLHTPLRTLSTHCIRTLFSLTALH